MKYCKFNIRLIPLVLALFFSINSLSSQSLKDKVIYAYKTTEIARAKAFLHAEPITVTASYSKRSSGGIHDFYSEGDYWWPDPDDPGGKYIRKDGQTNPDNFSDHRIAMIRLSEIVATLTSAWLLTEEQVFADQALEHLNAWFVDTATLMNPHMLYAQAIWGRVTGRGIGLIDAYHLVEVARSVQILEEKKGITQEQAIQIKEWFDEFLTWMTTHKYGIDEMNTENNHAVCWLATASSMAVLTDNQEITNLCTERFKTIALPDQMADDGSFPRELQRTKPYGYSLFNIDAFCNVAQILSNSRNNLWKFEADSGKSLQKGMEFIFPFIKDKTSWTYEKDIYIWEEWPVNHPALLFTGLAYKNSDYIETYINLPKYPVHPEVIRNLPVRHPVIWLFD